MNISRGEPASEENGMQNPDYEPSRLTAVRRGFFCRCPHCGEGRMFGAFLKVRDRCEVCGEELYHHRADDFPPYLVIVIVGHVVVTMILLVEIAYSPPIWLQFSIWLPFTIGFALALLQPVKGAVVALQWSLRMHGFEDRKVLPPPAAGAALDAVGPNASGTWKTLG
jgi:uncharacterized protein (DUF983 family)